MYSLAIDQIPAETRIALLHNDNLKALHIERTNLHGHGPVQAGNIYQGRVVNIVASLQAAFVDFGAEQNGFLPGKSLGCDDISKVLQQGQYLLVQVKKEPHEDKGALLSARLELEGRDCILTPQAPGINISRKFTDHERRHVFLSFLRENLPQDTGLIVRTSAENSDPDTLLMQAQKLDNIWQSICQSARQRPALLYRSGDFIAQIWDSYRHLRFDEIQVEGMDAFHTMKSLESTTVLHCGTRPLFETLHLNEQIEQAHAPEIHLDGGGTIIIERTKALIAIDINMGERTDGKDSETNKLHTNLSALHQIKEQISLRNLGGQILIDFIRMTSPKHRAQLYDACKKVFKDDPRCHLHGFTRLGLMELSRKRIGYALDELAAASLAPAIALVRKLAYLKGRPHLKMGTRLFHIWGNPMMKDSLDWLAQRLGTSPIYEADDTLAPLDYKMNE